MEISPEIKEDILIYLSNEIDGIDDDQRLSEATKIQRIVDLCNAMDSVEALKEKGEKSDKPILGALCRVE